MSSFFLQMKKQLEDVVYVAVVNILSSGKNAAKNYVERDLMLAKVSTAGTSKLQDAIIGTATTKISCRWTLH